MLKAFADWAPDAYNGDMTEPTTKTIKTTDGEMDAKAARMALQRAVGARVREIREDLKLGQAQCAEYAGLDKSSMFRGEKGEINFTLDTLGRLALALGVPIDEFLIGVTPDPALIERRTRG
ncbi:helix-turn-helix domain-containing protein [Sphingomonas sp. 22R3R2A-7]